jgi:hypothetical protein
MQTVNGLQNDRNLAFQRREWRVQRFAWWLLGAFVAAAALGLFGNGVLSRAHVRTPDGRLSVEYDRFVRAGARTRLTIRAAAIDPVELRLDREYFESFLVERITTEPSNVEIAGTTVQITFDRGAGGDFAILLDLEPLHLGRFRTTVQASGAPPVQVAQLAYF